VLPAMLLLFEPLKPSANVFTLANLENSSTLTALATTPVTPDSNQPQNIAKLSAISPAQAAAPAIITASAVLSLALIL